MVMIIYFGIAIIIFLVLCLNWIFEWISWLCFGEDAGAFMINFFVSLVWPCTIIASCIVGSYLLCNEIKEKINHKHIQEE